MGQDDLRSVLSKLPRQEGFESLLVGYGTNDDAAVLRIDGNQAIAQTVDFFTPIVDDPYLFGAIAATNSISDIYAMGATPILGLAIAAFPSDKLPLTVLGEILRGGAEKAAEAGFPIAGGHTIIDEIPKYGLAVTGLVPVDKVIRNSTARAGDSLYLTKPIGNGILVSAHRALHGRRLRRMTAPKLDEAIDWMLKLNRDAARVMVQAEASAATDITGYGLLGHLLEMCEGSRVGADLHLSEVPVLAHARDYLEGGYRPEGTLRNVLTFRSRIEWQGIEIELILMCDAQTSGGLLIAVPQTNESVLESGFQQSGLFYAKIGRLKEGAPKVTLVQ